MLGTGRLNLLAALCAALGLSTLASAPLASAVGWVSPLPRSDYTVRPVCAGALPGQAHCMALQLVARTAQARAHTHPIGLARAAAEGCEARDPDPREGCFGLRPQDLHSAYDLPTDPLGPQTIALVDAYNDPVAAEDLAVYSNEFDLPACTVANGCFSQVNEKGESEHLPFPASETELEHARKGSAEEAAGWALEISLDIETAHAVCEGCHIILVESSSPASPSLETAENTAAKLADEVSNSWGLSECSGFHDCVEDSAAFDHPGRVLAAAAGDDGYLEWLGGEGLSYAGYPASSPHVVAVGGTRLNNPLGKEWTGESVWNDGGESEGELEGYGATGGGCSVQFQAPAWQQAVSDWGTVGCGEMRAVSDVSAVGDPYSGLAVYDSGAGSGCGEEGVRPEHWCTIGGTSLATPLISAVFALAGGAGGVEYPAQTLYANVAESPTALHDVTEGSNGECLQPFDAKTGASGCTAAEEAASCESNAICLARAGYDGPSGLGTPDGIAAFTPGPHEPGARTGHASEVRARTATLEGSVEPNGEPIKECRFEYGEAPGYGSSVPCSSVPADTRGRPPVEAQVSALKPNTTYDYRLVVSTEKGTGKGETATFETHPEAAPTGEPGPGNPGGSDGPPAPPDTEIPPVSGSVVAGSTSTPKGTPAPTVPDARLASTSLMANRAWTVSVRVGCPAGTGGCKGTVSLRTLQKIVFGARAAASRSETPTAAILTLASAPFKLAAGASATVKLHLSAAGRALLAHARTLRARALLFARNPSGATHTAQTIVTIRAPASPAGKG